MALRIPKSITDALSAARAGESVDLSSITIPRLGGGSRLIKADEEQSDDGDMVRSFLLSDKSVDRDRDTIDPNGWDLSEFNVNGAVLFAHNNRGLPVAEPQNTRVDGKGDEAKLLGDARFPTKEVDEFGNLILRLIDDNILKNVSVGFIPVEWTINEERQGIDFTKQKLAEWSVVPVGSHPGAMVQLALQKGLNLSPLHDWATKWLDNDSSVANAIADDEEVQALHKSLSSWRTRSESGLVVPSQVARATEAVTKTEPVETPPEEDADPVERAVAGLAELAKQIAEVEIDDARRERALEHVEQAAKELVTQDDGLSEDDVRGLVRETILGVFKSPEPEPIERDEAVTLVREAFADLRTELLREAGRLPS